MKYPHLIVLFVIVSICYGVINGPVKVGDICYYSGDSNYWIECEIEIKKIISNGKKKYVRIRYRKRLSGVKSTMAIEKFKSEFSRTNPLTYITHETTLVDSITSENQHLKERLIDYNKKLIGYDTCYTKLMKRVKKIKEDFKQIRKDENSMGFTMSQIVIIIIIVLIVLKFAHWFTTKYVVANIKKFFKKIKKEWNES